MNMLFEKIKETHLSSQNKALSPYTRMDELESQIAELKGKLTTVKTALLLQTNRRSALIALSDQLEQEAYKKHDSSSDVNSILEDILDVRRQIRGVESVIADHERDLLIIQALHDSVVHEYKQIKEQAEQGNVQTALYESMYVLPVS